MIVCGYWVVRNLQKHRHTTLLKTETFVVLYSNCLLSLGIINQFICEIDIPMMVDS